MTECFKSCLSTLSEEEKAELSNAHVYKQLSAMMSLYCERRYRPGDASKSQTAVNLLKLLNYLCCVV